jgi:hypothetical protein
VVELQAGLMERTTQRSCCHCREEMFAESKVGSEGHGMHMIDMCGQAPTFLTCVDASKRTC